MSGGPVHFKGSTSSSHIVQTSFSPVPNGGTVPTILLSRDTVPTVLLDQCRAASQLVNDSVPVGNKGHEVPALANHDCFWDYSVLEEADVLILELFAGTGAIGVGISHQQGHRRAGVSVCLWDELRGPARPGRHGASVGVYRRAEDARHVLCLELLDEVRANLQRQA